MAFESSESFRLEDHAFAGMPTEPHCCPGVPEAPRRHAASSKSARAAARTSLCLGCQLCAFARSPSNAPFPQARRLERVSEVTRLQTNSSGALSIVSFVGCQC